MAYAGRFSVYRNKGDFDQAIADSEMAVRLDPNDAWYRERLEWVKATLDKYRL